MSSRIQIFFFSVSCLISTNSFADDLLGMLKRMPDADKNQNYQGTFILRKSDNLSTLNVTHGVDKDGDWEKLQSLSGESKKVFRRNQQVISVYPERKIVTLRYSDKEQSLHQTLPENLDQLTLFYSVQRLPDDRIANHQTLVIDLQPIDQFRYGYRYWIDKQTGMLLRCDLFDERKAVIEQMMFTSLDYHPTLAAEAPDLQKLDDYQQLNIDDHETATQMDEPQWIVNRLPKGFMLTQSNMRHLQPQLSESRPSNSALSSKPAQATVAGLQPVTSEPPTSVNKLPSRDATIQRSKIESTPAAASATSTSSNKPDLIHLVYSDGLASVSVFIENNQGVVNHLHGASSMGAMNAYGKAAGNYFVTVVGEVPAKTVQTMAQSTVRRH